ncbi:MAG TPA: 50S ribosomal protein L22 [Actinomycetota bacterium]|jgi:large subunit ribosomal protein L22|nr:50S ribosomal protein L22 [Actinomycetota bacterium]
MAQAPEQTREGKAVARFIPMSPHKVRRSADLVRNKPLQEARRLLAFSPLRGSKALSKVLESAVANAVNNFDLPEERLVVHRVFVDEGPTYKRWRAKAYGRAGRIRKRRSHITVVVRAAGGGS